MKWHNIPIEVFEKPCMRQWIGESEANFDQAVRLAGEIPAVSRFCGVSDRLAWLCGRIVNDHIVATEKEASELRWRVPHESEAIAALARFLWTRPEAERDPKY